MGGRAARRLRRRAAGGAETGRAETWGARQVLLQQTTADQPALGHQGNKHTMTSSTSAIAPGKAVGEAGSGPSELEITN